LAAKLALDPAGVGARYSAPVAVEATARHRGAMGMPRAVSARATPHKFQTFVISVF
jgi:hypothetical protein